jgi:adhesin transport system membrane fusion protein
MRRKFNISERFYILLRIAIDAFQLKIYASFKKLLVRCANLIRRVYDGITEKPDHAWLKPVAGAHMGTIRASSRIVFYTISALFITFLIWANFFEIDEYVHAQGKIQPESDTKTLSHFEGGVVQDILVKEGDIVKKNQVLLRLKDVSSQATYEESLHNYYLHWAQILRLKAQINQQPLVLPKAIQTFSPEIVKETMQHYNSRMDNYHNDEMIIKDQLETRESELTELKKKIENLESLYKLSLERTNLLGQLVNKNLVAKSQFIQSQLDTTNRKMEMESAKNNIAKLTAMIHESQDKLDQVKLHYDADDWQQLKDHRLRFTEAKKMIDSGKDRIDRTDLKSPVNGIVQQLFVHTIGSAVTSGKELVSIVPLKDMLLFEASVLPQDIGFIQKGQQATIKVSAYDYSIYGGLEGTVEHISPDAIQDPKEPQRTYYRVQIRTRKNTIDHHGKTYTIIPGETGQADIITAKRTIMQYLLKPIAKSLSDPLRER